MSDPSAYPPADQLYQSFDKNLYRITGTEESDDIMNMMNADPGANNSSSVQVSASDLGSGVDTSTTVQTTGALKAGKSLFDNTASGYILGVDAKDGLAKFYIGNTTSYLNWDGTSMTIKGSISASSIDIPDTVTANSFHVDSSGNAWWGATTLGAAPAKVLSTGAATFTSITIGGYVATSTGTFGGNGSDGALSITSGTTTISLGSASYVVKNYTSISITGTGALAFSSPNTNGTIITLRSQGAVALTSATTPLIDLRGNGAAGGNTSGSPSSNGSTPNALVLVTNDPKGITGSGGGTGGAGGKQYDMPNFYTTSTAFLSRRYVAVAPGAGGACGESNNTVGGNGGAGSGALVIECAGALNFTGTINASGSDGSQGVASTGSNRSGGGGGGGGAGIVVILYNTLTASSGTITAAGGAGGASGVAAGATGGNAGGGGGGGSLNAAGGAGGNSNIAGTGAAGTGAGGGGGGGSSTAGVSFAGGGAGATISGLVAQNTLFA